MTPTITKINGDIFTIVDSDTTVGVFNGTAVVQVPKVIFEGTLVQAQAALSLNQSNVDKFNAVTSAIQSYNPPQS